MVKIITSTRHYFKGINRTIFIHFKPDFNGLHFSRFQFTGCIQVFRQKSLQCFSPPGKLRVSFLDHKIWLFGFSRYGSVSNRGNRINVYNFSTIIYFPITLFTVNCLAIQIAYCRHSGFYILFNFYITDIFCCSNFLHWLLLYYLFWLLRLGGFIFRQFNLLYNNSFIFITGNKRRIFTPLHPINENKEKNN